MAIDVTIMGAGIFGLSTAWECVKRGATVQVIDPNGPGSGASGGVLGALTPHTPDQWNSKKSFQFRALSSAQEFWSAVRNASSIDPGYSRIGRLQPIHDEKGLMLAQERVSKAAANWGEGASWKVARCQDFGSWAPQSETGWLVHDNLSARLHPRNAIRALSKAILSLGGRIQTSGDASGLVLWATGADGLNELNTWFGAKIGGAEKGQAALLRFDADNAPQIFADSVHIVPHSDGTTAIGSTSERDFDDATSTDERLDLLVRRARDLVPELERAPVLERWASLRPRAASRAPILDCWPGRDGHFIANGGFKIGLGLAPEVARVMADLMLEGREEIPPLFRLDTSLKGAEPTTTP